MNKMIHNPDAALPEHFKEVKSINLNSLNKHKQSALSGQVFNGNIWVGVDKYIKKVDQLTEITQDLAETLREVNRLMIQNPTLNVTMASQKVRKSLEFFETGVKNVER